MIAVIKNQATPGSSVVTKVAYKRSWRGKIAPTHTVFLKTQTGEASAAVAVKDLRPLARRACSRVLDRDPRCGCNVTYGSVPAPVFTKPESKKEEKKIVFVFDPNHPLRK